MPPLITHYSPTLIDDHRYIIADITSFSHYAIIVTLLADIDTLLHYDDDMIDIIIIIDDTIIIHADEQKAIIYCITMMSRFIRPRHYH